MHKMRACFRVGPLLLFGLYTMAQPPQSVDANPANPGPEHTWLAGLQGRWDMSIKVWQGPGESMEAQATSENTLILGGRYLQLHSQGKMGPLSIESQLTLGFDRRRNIFTCYGIDTLGTFGVFAEGKASSDGNTVVFKGENLDPASGQSQAFRFELKKQTADRFQFSVFFAGPEGTDILVSEITYTLAM